MNKPVATVIIPAYNHENYIEQCLESVISQTYENIELVIINDGSTDKTGEIISSWCERLFDRFPRFVFVNKPNEGMCKALNMGLDLSVGEYVAVCASDDIMLPMRIEKQVQYLQDRKAYAMVFTDGYEVEDKGAIALDNGLDNYERFSNRFDINKHGFLFDWLVNNLFFMPSPSACITRWCYEEIGGYDERITFEDPDIFLRVSDRFKFGFVDEPLFIHRIHGKNSGRDFVDVIEPAIHAMIEKYEKEEVFSTNRDTRKLLDMLARTIGTIPSNILEKIEGKKVIGWGTGSVFQRAMKKHDISLAFLVDSNAEKHGGNIEGLDIFPPDALLDEDKDQVFVIVFSQFCVEIELCLVDYGFVFGENYM